MFAVIVLVFLCTHRHLLTVGLAELEGVVYLDDQDRKMIVTRSGGMRPQLLADCHVPPDLRFTFYDQVHTTGACINQSPCRRHPHSEPLLHVARLKHHLFTSHSTRCRSLYYFPSVRFRGTSLVTISNTASMLSINKASRCLEIPCTRIFRRIFPTR